MRHMTGISHLVSPANVYENCPCFWTTLRNWLWDWKFFNEFKFGNLAIATEYAGCLNVICWLQAILVHRFWWVLPNIKSVKNYSVKKTYLELGKIIWSLVKLLLDEFGKAITGLERYVRIHCLNKGEFDLRLRESLTGGQRRVWPAFMYIIYVHLKWETWRKLRIMYNIPTNYPLLFPSVTRLLIQFCRPSGWLRNIVMYLYTTKVYIHTCITPAVQNVNSIQFELYYSCFSRDTCNGR